jgi:tetratricopeptide (TPR) repeat protein
MRKVSFRQNVNHYFPFILAKWLRSHKNREKNALSTKIFLWIREFCPFAPEKFFLDNKGENNLNQKLAGKAIAAERRKQGKSMEELADEEISASTISNIEKGDVGVQSLKIDYLLSKLGIKDLDDAISDYKNSRRVLHIHMMAVENMIRYDAPISKKALQLIKSKLEKNDPYHPWKKYLSGKLNQITHPQSAIDFFLSAIAQANSNEEYDPNFNIIASCYLSMGMIEYHSNNLQQALEYIEKGIESFVDRGDRQSTKYKLYFNKALFLIKLGKYDEADIVIKKTWSNLHKIPRMSTRLKFYQLKADVLRHRKEYEQAVNLLEEAIWLAMDNNLYDVSFILWATLGEILAETDFKEFTSESFNVSLSFSEKVNTSYLVEVYADIAKHYILKQEWSEAETFIEKATDLVGKDKLKLINLLSVQGDLYFERNELDKASEYYKEAQVLSNEYNLHTKEHQLLYKLIKCNKHNKKKQHELLELRFELEERMEAVDDGERT